MPVLQSATELGGRRPVAVGASRYLSRARVWRAVPWQTHVWADGDALLLPLHLLRVLLLEKLQKQKARHAHILRKTGERFRGRGIANTALTLPAVALLRLCWAEVADTALPPARCRVCAARAPR